MRRRVKGVGEKEKGERYRGGRGGTAELGEDVWQAVTLESCIIHSMITSKVV